MPIDYKKYPPDWKEIRDRIVNEHSVDETESRIIITITKMKNKRKKIFKQIHDERKIQDERWGGKKNDDENSADDWYRVIDKHNSRASDENGQDRRYALIRVAAIAVAAIESFDRNKRH